MTAGLLLVIQLIQIILLLKFFPIESQHYSSVRTMLLKSLITSIIGCIGLCTYPYSLELGTDKWYYVVKIFVGLPTANSFLSYSLYTSSQMITLLRAKNMGRRTIVRGTDNIYVVSYVGRDGNNSQKSQWNLHIENMYNDV